MKKPIAYLKLNHVLLCSAIGFTSLNAMAESTNNAIICFTYKPRKSNHKGYNF